MKINFFSSKHSSGLEKTWFAYVVPHSFVNTNTSAVYDV